MITRKALLFILLLLPPIYLPAGAQTVSSVNPESEIKAAEVRLKTFEKVWTTVNEKHFDPDFGGVNWGKVGESYKPKALAAGKDEEFYQILQEMLGELNQSHFGIYPPNQQISVTGFGEADIGIEIQIIDRQVVITEIVAGSPAEQKGLKTGFLIKKIDGKPVAEMLKPLETRLAKRKDTEAKKQLFRERVLMTSIGGKADSSVELEILDDRDKIRVLQIPRVVYRGEMSQPLGNFPAQRVVFEQKRLPENVGYIRFNVWVLPQMLKLRKAMRLLSDAEGIIFDLRGNPGGIGAMASALAALLMEKQCSLGTMKTRGSEASFAVYPQKDAFTGKIVVLTDYGSGSTSEIFAAGLQDIGRAKIVGETTAGAVLPSVMERLPTGALFQYAIADYKSPNKIFIEGRGVQPDIVANLTRDSLLKGRDLQIEAAVKEILRKK